MHKFKFLHVRCASPFLKAFLRLILAIAPWLLSAILQNLRSLQRENYQVLSLDQKAVKRFQKFQRQDSWKNDLWSKSCINIFFTSEWTRCSILEWWLRWFSQVRKRCEWRVEKKKKLERRLNAFEFCVSNIAKAIDNIFVYSYQYNIKITSDRETSEETANFCLMMFASIGVDISISDINIAHRVQTRKLGFSVILQLWAMFDYGCACLSNWSQNNCIGLRPVYAGGLLSIPSPSSLVPIIIFELNNAGVVCIIVESWLKVTTPDGTSNLQCN